MLFPAVIPTVGVQAMMDTLIARLNDPASVSRVHLYTNDYAPGTGTTLSDFTEATFGGYLPLPLGLPTQSTPSPSGRAIWTWPMSVWTTTGATLPEIIHGMWVDFVDPLTGLTSLAWTQRFNVPQGLWLPAQVVNFTLSLGCQTPPV